MENQAAQNTGTPAVEIKGLKKAFGKNHILKDVNLTLNKGENLIILGKSGTGKSVLIKCLVKLIEPDAGELIILGNNITHLDDGDLNETRKKIGFLFQSAALYDSMTVRENLEFPLREARMKKSDLGPAVEEALQNVGLLSAIDKMPSELSGGMRKRVGLARALILKPQIMLYDEPTTGLDTVTSKEISKLVLETQKNYNTSSIIITHDMDCAKITSNRIIVLNDGVFIAEGTFDELKNSEDKRVSCFFE